MSFDYCGHRVEEGLDDFLKTKTYANTDGVFMYWFACNNKNTGENFYKGHICRGFGIKEDTCFLKLCDIDHGQHIFDCYTVSLNFTIPWVLKLKGVGLDRKREGVLNNTHVFVAYDVFDDSLNSWVVKNKNGLWMDKSWWIRQIIHILEAMYVIDLENIPLGVLSLMVRGNDLYLKDVGFNDSTTSKTQLLKNFLECNAHCLFYHVDWKYFIAAFDHSSVDQLLQHPLLLDQIERYNYYGEISDHLSMDMTKLQLSQFWSYTLTMDKERKFMFWEVHVKKHPLLMAVMNHLYADAHRNRKLASDLIGFIEHVFDHQSEKAEKVETIKCEEKFISETFKGYLSFLHAIFITHFGDADITRKHYKSIN